MKHKSVKALINFIMTIIGITFLFPLFWMLNISFKTRSEVYDNPFGLPEEWVLTTMAMPLKNLIFQDTYQTASFTR